jgi:hypothetical protein
MSPPRSKSLLRAARWILPAAALAFAPKCLLCVLAYAGLGAALGLGGREWCGAPAAGSSAVGATSLAWLGIASVLGMVGFLANRRHRS